jgi:glycosyltransferase involved in cell wall biosynthesis
MRKIKRGVNKNPILSVIVPISNMAGNLKYIQSWSTETDKYSMEVILVHDIADSETSKELKDLIQKLKNPEKFTILEGKYGGPGAARNKGLEIAKGEWVAFWDSDDKPMLSNVYKYILVANFSDEIIVGGFITNNISNDHINHNNALKASVKSVSINPGLWRMVFRRNTINYTRFSNFRAAEDQLFLANMKFAERKIMFVSDIFYEYTLGQKNQLTNSVKAISDIPSASKAIYFLSLESSKAQMNFNLMMIIRQQLTIIKHGTNESKFEAFKFLILYFKNANFPIFFATIKAFLELTFDFKKNYIK